MSIRLAPARFPLLMSLYEDNYRKLRLLLPQLRKLQGDWQSDVAGSAPLWVRVLAQEKHTTMLLLTHQFRRSAEAGDDPLAYVRVYHDTRQAEVTHLRVGSALRELFRADQDTEVRVQTRLRLNIFFGKWLDFIEKCGHGEAGFVAVKVQADAQTDSQLNISAENCVPKC